MTKDLSKFIAFVAAHPKLLGRSSLFGAVHEDHTAFRLFVEYIKQQKLIYHTLPKNLGIAEFKAYILTQDATKYQEIIAKIDTLHRLGYLHDQLGFRDLRDLAVIFDELGMDTINPRFAEARYNQLLFDSFTQPQSPQTGTAEHGEVASTEPIKQPEVSQAPRVTENQSSEKLYSEQPSYGGGGTIFGGAAIATSTTDAVDFGVKESNQTTAQVLQETTLQESAPQETVPPVAASPAVENITPERKEDEPPTQTIALPSELASIDGPAQDSNLSLDLALSETPEESFSALGSTQAPLPPLRGKISRPVAPARIQSHVKQKSHTFRGPAAAKGGQNIKFLDTVSGLRQRTPNTPNFAQDEDEQPQAEGYNQAQRAEGTGKVTEKQQSPGKVLFSRIAKISALGIGGIWSIIPSADASAQVLKKVVTIGLFSLILVVNVPLINELVHPGHFTAYAADPVPAAAVPAATCPAPFKAGDTPEVCVATPAPLDLTCPPEFSKPTRNGDTLTCTAASAEVQKSAEDLKKLTSVIVGIQQFLNRVIWPVLVMIGGLMDSSLLFGSGMEERLRDIWIPMRNLVNILFVLVLVGVALYNVLGIGEEGGSYSIKAILPKVVVGIIAVNFSFLGIKVVLDATNAITTSIFSLPSDVSIGLGKVLDKDSEEGKEMMHNLCAKIQDIPVDKLTTDPETAKKETSDSVYRQVASKHFKNQILASTTRADIESLVSALPAENQTTFNEEVASLTSKQMCEGAVLSKAGEDYLSEWSSHSAALAMALNMGGIVFYDRVPPEITSLDKLFTNAVFSTAMYIIYVASFVALFIVLLGRLLVMWISVAMSPLLVLIMFSSELKDKMGGFAKLEEQFTKNAIAPIIIAISMTVGWIMLNALKGLNTISTNGTVSLYDIIPNNGVPVSSLDTLGDFVVALGTIGVVWLGVFSAAEGTVAEGAVNMIKGALESTGKFIGNLPLKHLPMVPIRLPGQAEATNYSLGNVLGAAQTFANDTTNPLVTALNGGDKLFTGKSFADSSIVKDQKTFLEGLSRAGSEGKFRDKNFVKDFKDSMSKRKDIMNQLPPQIKGKVQAVLDSDDTNINARVNTLLDTTDPVSRKRIRDLDPLDTKDPSYATPPAPPAAPSIPPLSPDQAKDLSIGGTKVSAQITAEAVESLNLAREAVVTSLGAITDPAHVEPDAKADLEANLMRLSIGDDGKLPNDTELAPLLGGPANAEKILKVYGGKTGYNDMIINLTEQRAAAKRAKDAADAEEAEPK